MIADSAMFAARRADWGSVELGGLGVGIVFVGIRSRTRRSLRWGSEDVAIASIVGSVGQRAMLDGVKIVQDIACGARFCVPISVGLGVVGR